MNVLLAVGTPQSFNSGTELVNGPSADRVRLVLFMVPVLLLNSVESCDIVEQQRAL